MQKIQVSPLLAKSLQSSAREREREREREIERERVNGTLATVLSEMSQR